MNYEKIEFRRKSFCIFCSDGYMYSETMNTRIKLTCGVFSLKKTSGTAFIEFGKFFNKSTIIQKVLRRSKKQELRQE